ncbi:hypothetical protein [Hymenobacter norwichensis]|uniref:hypothetical protein n=1 Tax=Hymenobacter norwichensis TaxID=223903 RepID=UPI0003FFEB08|nr:hypothetical protein [Hymenobacter norwichensis]
MTERESKEFYDDLRRKLEEYGSPPPESVWAGIRQQVPNRRRRWWRGALLVLLLVGTVSYLTISTRTQRPTPISTPAAVATVSPGAQADASVSSGSSSRPQSAAAQAPSTGLSPNTGAAPSLATPETQPGTNVATQETAPTASRQADRGLIAGRLTDPTGKAPRQVLAPDSATQPQSEASGATLAATSTTSEGRKQHKARAGVALVVLPKQYPNPTRRQIPAASLETTYAEPTNKETHPEQEAAKNLTAGLSSEGAAYGSSSLPTNQTTLFGGRLLPLLVRLQLPGLPLPRPTAVLVPEVRQPQPIKPNWAIQALGGPTVSYRKLGANVRRVEQLERPAAGYGMQLGVARTLTPRLSLSVGVGYTEVAASLYLRLQKADSVPLVITRLRDYYRLLTVPMEAHYLLGATTRWRYGVQAGVAPALLLSARTTEGGACNCQQQQWQPSDSTRRFRQLNLTLTAGAFVGYQAAPGLWLTLRPQAQYFLNSITDPTSGRAARHPWSVGVQGGISFDLPFKP